MKNLSLYKTLFAITLVLCFSNLGKSQVVYTEITPNHNINDGILFLDINNDGINDVNFEYQFINPAGGSTFHLTSSQLINIQSTAEGNSIQNYSVNDSINGNCEWLSNSYLELKQIGSSGCSGNWCSTNDGFMAIKLTADNQTYYGWIRIYVLEGEHSHLAIASYAYNQTPNEPILAGEGMQNGASSVVAFDEFNYTDGRDINVSFNKAIDKTQLSEYRIMVTKADDENAGNLEYLSQLTEDYHNSYPANGGLVRASINLSEDIITIDGEDITTFTDYKIIILNVSQDGNPEANSISQPSNVFQLNTPPLPINRITALDIDNDGNSSDIKVNFYEEEENAPFIEYRLFIAKTENNNEFSSSDAIELDQDYYTSVEVTNSQEYSIQLNSNQLDISGDEIIEDEFYSIFILSVADSIANYTNALSEPSRKIILETPNRFYAGQKNGDFISWHPCDSLFTEYPEWGGQFPGYEKTNYIDVNRDGINDFKLFAKSRTEFYSFYYRDDYILRITSLRENKILTSGQENWLEILNEGDIIGDGYEQSSGSIILCSHTEKTYYGGDVFFEELLGHYPFENEAASNYYIGLMINDLDIPQYAWIRLSSTFLKEYGYQELSTGNTSDSCLTDGIQFSSQEDLDQFTSDYPNCKHIEGDVIFEGENITSLNALNQIVSVDGNVFIRNCNELTDINGLQNLDLNSLISIEITNNPNLSECNIENICNYLNDNGNILIENNKEGCQSNEEVKSSCANSIPELTALDCEIHPNPASQFIKIKAISKYQSKLSIEIINSYGSIMDSFEMNDSELMINTESYSAGLYFVQIINSNGHIETHKLIIE